MSRELPPQSPSFSKIIAKFEEACEDDDFFTVKALLKETPHIIYNLTAPQAVKYRLLGISHLYRVLIPEKYAGSLEKQEALLKENISWLKELDVDFSTKSLPCNHIGYAELVDHIKFLIVVIAFKRDCSSFRENVNKLLKSDPPNGYYLKCCKLFDSPNIDRELNYEKEYQILLNHVNAYIKTLRQALGVFPAPEPQTPSVKQPKLATPAKAAEPKEQPTASREGHTNADDKVPEIPLKQVPLVTADQIGREECHFAKTSDIPEAMAGVMEANRCAEHNWLQRKRSTQQSTAPEPKAPKKKKCVTVRKRRIPFSAQEEATLLKGVRMFRADKDIWATILKTFKDSFAPTRTSVDLKDKWRNIKKRMKDAPEPEHLAARRQVQELRNKRKYKELLTAKLPKSVSNSDTEPSESEKQSSDQQKQEPPRKKRKTNRKSSS